jgi:hypothetical protein
MKSIMAGFTEKQIQDVWNKGTPSTNADCTKYRRDVCEAWIQFDKYGTEDEFGWEIDHIYPESMGGDDALVNLRPMHWENARSKSNDFPTYTSAKSSEGYQNIDKAEQRTIHDGLISDLKKIYKFK